MTRPWCFGNYCGVAEEDLPEHAYCMRCPVQLECAFRVQQDIFPLRVWEAWTKHWSLSHRAAEWAEATVKKRRKP